MTRSSNSGGFQESAPTRPVFTDPLSLAFQGLFGTGDFRFSQRQGGFIMADPGDNRIIDPFASQIFGDQNFASLGDQLNPVGQSPFSQLATQNLFGADQAFSDTIDFFQNTLLPEATNIGQTGLPTDIDSIIAQQMNQFNQQIIPDLANQFAFLGGGGNNILSSDFGAAAANAGGDLSANLGALQFQADESAAERQLQGLQLAGAFGQTIPDLAQIQAALPAAVGSDILSLDEQNFDLSLLQQPGGQFMNLLSNLLNIIQTEPIVGTASSGGQHSSTLGIIG